MFKGSLLILQGIRALLQQTKLRQVLRNMYLTLLLLSSVLMLCVFYATQWLAALWLPLGEAWWWQILTLFVWLGSFIISAALAMLSYIVLSGVITSPALDQLASLLDQHETSSQSSLTQIRQSFQSTLQPLVVFATWGSIALLCLLVPIIGPFLATFFWFYACTYVLTLELIDVPCSRRNLSVAQRKQLLKKHRFFYLGFGLTAMCLMLIPLVNILVLPGAIVGLMQQSKEAGLAENC